MPDQMVIDASVVAKWFLSDEADKDAADKLLLLLLADEIEMSAPRVLLNEVCGLLTKACLTRVPETGANRLSLETAENCVRQLYDLPIRLADTDADAAGSALEMAVRFHKTFNDMTYVGLAQRLQCQWCTADRKFFQAVPADFPAQVAVELTSPGEQPAAE